MSIKLSAIHAKGMTSCVETKVAEGEDGKRIEIRRISP